MVRPPRFHKSTKPSSLRRTKVTIMTTKNAANGDDAYNSSVIFRIQDDKTLALLDACLDSFYDDDIAAAAAADDDDADEQQRQHQVAVSQLGGRSCLRVRDSGKFSRN